VENFFIVATIFLENMETAAFNSIYETAQLLVMEIRFKNFAPSHSQLYRFLRVMKLKQIVQSFSDETSPFHTNKRSNKQTDNKTNNRQMQRWNLHLPHETRTVGWKVLL